MERVANEATGHEGGVERCVYDLARFDLAAQFLFCGNIEITVEVPHAHAGDDLGETGVFGAAVESVMAVPFVDDIVMFSVEPSVDFWLATELIDHDMIVPAPVDVAGAASIAPNIAALTVEEGLIALFTASDEIPFGAGKGVFVDFLKPAAPLDPGRV